MKKFGIIVAVILGIGVLSVVGLGLKALLFPLHTVKNIVQSQYDISDKTFDADNVIYNYEWFKQRYEDIQALERKILIAQNTIEDFKSFAGDRTIWTFEDKTEFSRLNAVSQGLMNQMEDIVAEYNARSKMANRNIFQEGILPDILTIGSNILHTDKLKKFTK